tara:strand:- start:1376 stop:1918 length:543 start_codon:yes stop_codon:yes gene_type:complete
MKNDLSKTLRKIIREEVGKAVRKEFVDFVSLLGEIKTPKKKAIKPRVPKDKLSESSIKKMVDDIVPSNKKEQTKFTKNSVLNSILNETQGGLPQDGTIPPQPQGQEEWPTMGGEGKTFDRNSMAEMMGYGNGNPVSGMSTPDGRPVSPEQVPNAVSNAMTRNYGDLMKAIDKKKNGPLKG